MENLLRFIRTVKSKIYITYDFNIKKMYIEKLDE